MATVSPGPEWFDSLRRVDTPTVCNALELAMGGRSALGFTYGTPVAAPGPLPAIVGYARTATIRASAPGKEPAEALRTRHLGYYRHVVPQSGHPTVVVMQDQDAAPGVGSFWGEVNTTVHQALGVSGVLTNGSVRDIDMLAPGFPVIAGSIGPSHAFVHITGFGGPVTVFGLTVQPDDLIHADRHGAVLIPREIAQELPRCIELVSARERPILEAARRPGFCFADLEQAMKIADDIH